MRSEHFDLFAQIEERHWWFLGRRDIVVAVVREALASTPRLYQPKTGDKPSPRPRVVDIGCGTGAILAALATDCDCYGIDQSPDAVRLAQSRFPNVHFQLGSDPADLVAEARAAQVYLLLDVLEHVPDDFELLSRWLAAIPPRAYFLATVPADMKLWSPHDESVGHYRRYSPERLARVWEGLPVEVCLVSHFNSRLYPLVRWIRRANQRAGRARGDAGTDFRIPPRPLNWLLRCLFSGESRELIRQMRRDAAHAAYTQGVSLLAVLRRKAGDVEVRRKPADMEPDAAAAPCWIPRAAG